MREDQVKDKASFLTIPSVEEHISGLSTVHGPQEAKTEMMRIFNLNADT